jgi:hypothetical protein
MMTIYTEDRASMNNHINNRRNKHAPPENKTNGPTLSAKDVAQELGVSRQWVLQLAKRSPAEFDNFLPGYIKKRDGEGWERKIGPSDSRAGVFFYREDVERYKAQHPEPQDTDLSTVDVAPELRALIMEIARPELITYGYVTRTKVRDILMENYQFSDRVYKRVMKVAQEEQWPMPKLQSKNTGKKRRGKRKKLA